MTPRSLSIPLMAALLGATLGAAAGTRMTEAAAPNAPGTTLTSVSSDQYHLHNSDGTTWQAINMEGGKAVTLTLAPAVASQAVITANLDLWTANAGVNQDIAIFVDGQLAGWKESGGFAGTFSPNAATVQVVVPLTANAIYTVDLRWKTNKPAPPAAIFAGAGPYPADGGLFSPTRLTAFTAADADGVIFSKAWGEQFRLHGNDGVSWQPMTDDIGVPLEVDVPAPSQPMTALVTANVDLFTGEAGVNQDVRIASGAWKESGGFAGTFSPNAALVQGLANSSSGWNRYGLSWKTNKSAPNATIYAGAGPGPGRAFSPTRLTVILWPASIALYGYLSMTAQYRLTDSDGKTFKPISSDPGQAIRTWVELQVPCTVVLTANADLWTSTPGINQDLAIVEYRYNGTPLNPPLVLAWKESGGFAGTYSPNAAFVQAVVRVPPGITDFDLRWKTNQPANGATIWAGAGPDPPDGNWLQYSPTSLYLQLTDC